MREREMPSGLSRFALSGVLAAGVLAGGIGAASAAGVLPAKGGSGDPNAYVSIFTDGALKGSGWASCPTAIIWDADVSDLSPKAGGFALQDLDWALSTWGNAAGVPVSKGAEGKLAYDNGAATVSGGGSGRKLFIKFVKDEESNYLSGRVVGVATPTKVIPQATEIIGGSAAFRVDYVEYANKSESRALLLHELGHALGLGHSSDKKSVMYPIVSQTVGLSSGDLSGIKAFTKKCDPSLDAQRQ